MPICMRSTTVRHVHGSSSTSYVLQKHYSNRLAVLLTAMVLFSCLMANQKVPNSDAIMAPSRHLRSAGWPGTQQSSAEQPGLVLSNSALSSLAWYSATQCSAAWPGTQQLGAQQPGLALSNLVLTRLCFSNHTCCG